jgi:hypothetical protein
MMSKSSVNSLYNRVVDITTEYLGPAADRFVNRQIRNHLKKNPEQLRPRDLGELINWIKLTMALLTDDTDIVSEYIAELRRLTRNDKK